MITAKAIRKGIDDGVVRFIVDPNLEHGTVCAIGNSWFYFGGETAEVENPSEYLEHIPIEDAISKVISTLGEFKNDDTFVEEYKYYESVLNETAGPIVCPRCKKISWPNANFCWSCGCSLLGCDGCEHEKADRHEDRCWYCSRNRLPVNRDLYRRKRA